MVPYLDKKSLPLYQVIVNKYTLVVYYDGGVRKGQARPIVVVALYPHKYDNTELALLVYDVDKRDLRTYLAARMSIIDAFISEANTRSAYKAITTDVRKGGERSNVNSIWSIFSKKPIPSQLERYGFPNTSITLGQERRGHNAA